MSDSASSSAGVGGGLDADSCGTGGAEEDDCTSGRVADAPPPKLTPLRIAGQLVGFAIGVGLLVWCLSLAWQGEDGLTPFDHFRRAPWWALGGMIACTIVSLGANGLIFALVLRPFRDVGLWNMQLLNLASNALNYLPLRPGMLARIAYHLRVDGLGILTIGAAFAAVSLLLLLVTGVLGFASLVAGALSVWWFVLVVGGLFAGVVFALLLARAPVVSRYGRGFDRVLRDHGMVWWLIVLRVIDVAAYTGRLGFAMVILGLTINSLAYLVLIGIVAMLFGLFPIRIGFREAGLAMALGFAAEWFGQPEISRAMLSQLALIESAGEAMVFIPLGVCVLPWLRRRWIGAASRDAESSDSSVAGSPG